MNVFGVVSFVYDVEVRLSGSVRLVQEFLGMGDIMDRMLRDLQTADDLERSIDGD